MIVADDPIPIDTTKGKPRSKVKKVRVKREPGVCPLCKVPGDLVFAYDESIYEGGRCGDCLLHRTGEITSHKPDSKIMQPIMITARGTLGEEPFASMLRAADEQNPKLLEESLKKLGSELEENKRERELQENHSLLKRQGLLTLQGKPNRAARRRAEAIERKKARRARKAARRKTRGQRS